MPPSPFPAQPSDVTAEWLAEVLGQPVGDVTQERVGTGQVGQSVRFSWEGDGPLRSVVGKFSSDDPTSRATGVAMRNYEREVRFYQEIADTVGIRTPACYAAHWDPETGDSLLLLEDLSPARQGDQVAGCSPAQAALALDELARLHAPRWDDPDLDQLDWLSRIDPTASAMTQALYGAVWPGFVDRYGARLPAEVLAVGEKLGEHLARWMDEREGPLTVTHGDYRLDNMLFGTPDGGYPLAVVDWQTPGHGAGAADCSYFIGAGLLVEDRRAHEEELVRHYHRALVANGVEGYEWDQCWHDYRTYAFSGLLMAVVASMVVGQSDRGDDMFVAMAERHGLACIDLGSVELLPA